MSNTTNFQIFNEAMLNLMSDSDYTNAIQRQRGVVPGLAVPALHNKLFLQTSIMCKALADFIVAQGYDALDSNVSTLMAALSNAIIKIAQDNIIAGKNMWTPNTDVVLGDVMYTADGNGPRWAYLLCTTAGTTGAIEPVVASNVVVGQTIVDNDVTWTVKSVVETIIEFCTQAEAEAGTDNTKATTPLRVAQAIAILGAQITAASLGTNGYIKINFHTTSNYYLYIQWGRTNVVSSTDTTLTQVYPIAYSYACYAVILGSGADGSLAKPIHLVGTPGLSSFSYRLDGSSLGTNVQGYWMAIGH